MNIDSVKLELINWISGLEDKNSISKLLRLKKNLSEKKTTDKELFGSGKSLIEYISDDFNEPLNIFKDYQK